MERTWQYVCVSWWWTPAPWWRHSGVRDNLSLGRDLMGILDYILFIKHAYPKKTILELSHYSECLSWLSKNLKGEGLKDHVQGYLEKYVDGLLEVHQVWGAPNHICTLTKEHYQGRGTNKSSRTEPVTWHLQYLVLSTTCTWMELSWWQKWELCMTPNHTICYSLGLT